MSPQEFDAQVIAMMDPPATTGSPAQQDRAKWWNSERTGEPCKPHCCRCGERVKAHHNGVDGGTWFVHSRCTDKPASYQESAIQ